MSSGHGLRYLVNCSFLFNEVPFLERAARAKAAGFDAAEMAWPFDSPTPLATEVERFVEAFTSAEVKLVNLNFFGGDRNAGERGVLSHPGREGEFLDNVRLCADIGARLGVTGFNALYGLRLDGVSAEEQDELATENLVAAMEIVDRIGARVLIEPMSGDIPYPLRTLEDAVNVVERARKASGRENIRALADLYHLTTNGENLDEVLARFVESIGHVQVADSPGRHEPGTGSLDVEAILSLLEGFGYREWVSLEYSPSGTSEESFAWLAMDRRSTH